ncbi:hypothetical protein [Seramator thermalis]|uniref:hypothetical protein n=1 Tax=Seramator thermalis TaxID=2496270 RepID=UPI00101D7068|nr:hypothetical protein [Seramator thermalis]
MTKKNSKLRNDLNLEAKQPFKHDSHVSIQAGLKDLDLQICQISILAIRKNKNWPSMQGFVIPSYQKVALKDKFCLSGRVIAADSRRRINSAVMKIRLFKSKKVFNSRTHHCLKGKNIHNRRSSTWGQRHNNQIQPERQNYCSCIENICVGERKPTELKFVIGNLKFPSLHSFSASNSAIADNDNLMNFASLHLRGKNSHKGTKAQSKTIDARICKSHHTAGTSIFVTTPSFDVGYSNNSFFSLLILHTHIRHGKKQII